MEGSTNYNTFSHRRRTNIICFETGRNLTIQSTDLDAKKKQKVVVDSEILDSPAFMSLTGAAPQIYLQFLRRRQFARIGPPSKSIWSCINEQSIEFPYSQAKKLGVSMGSFARAIDQIIDHGLLDITFTGHKGGRATLYGMSERWRKYGTEQFQKAGREKDRRQVGFLKNNAPYSER